MSPRPIEPERAEAFEACVERARGGAHREAIRDLTAALAGVSVRGRLQGLAVNCLGRIGRLAEEAGDLESAEGALAEAARLAPGFADVHYRLALVRLAAQKRAEARRDLDAALRINPRYVGARVERALLDAREGFLGEALDALRQLGREARAGDSRVFGEGLASLQHADWDEAGTLLRRALRLSDPGPARAIEEFHARRAGADPAGALETLQAALDANPDYADLHYLMGTAELEEGAYDDAVASLAHALEIQPDYHAARVQLARALEALGDVAQAEEQAALVLESDPSHPQALELSERWVRLHRAHRRATPAARAAGAGSAKAAETP